MKILRTKGVSFTELKKEARTGRENDQVSDMPESSLAAKEIERGLCVKDVNDPIHPSFGTQNGTISPSDVGDYLEYNNELALRQIISVLDKIIQKPRRLSSFSLQSYIERTNLAEALWAEYANKYLTESRDNGGEYYSTMQKRWRARVHPYARFPVDWASPGTDDNAGFLRERDQGRKAAGKSVGKYVSRWAKAFGMAGQDLETNDYRRIAEAIIIHLFAQEHTLHGSCRQSTKEYGLVHNRGFSIQESANNPANTTKKDKWTWSDEVQDFYFSVGDIAREIYLEILEGNETHYNKAWFGNKFYVHYGRLIDILKENDFDKWEELGFGKDEIRNLHNRIRDYYRRIAEGNRLKILLKQKKESERKQINYTEEFQWGIRKILPRDKDHLLDCLIGRKRNTDISRYIRLGKIVAHAADIEDESEAEDFHERLQFFATSAGQSEIKRNESFVRVWRTCVAYSIRTLRPWADPERKSAKIYGREKNLLDYDLANTNVAVEILKHSQSEDGKREFSSNFDRHTPIIFGAKDYRHPALADSPINRSSLFCDSDVEEKRELIWAMLCLAGETRKRTVHFNTKRRLIKVISNNILHTHTKKSRKDDFSGRLGNVATENALKTIGKLLDFDLGIEAQVLADELNRLEFPKYARSLAPEKRQSACALLYSGLGSTDIVTPKFMRVLQHVVNLSKNKDTTVHQSLSGFDGLDLTNRQGNTRSTRGRLPSAVSASSANSARDIAARTLAFASLWTMGERLSKCAATETKLRLTRLRAKSQIRMRRISPPASVASRMIRKSCTMSSSCK